MLLKPAAGDESAVEIIDKTTVNSVCDFQNLAETKRACWYVFVVPYKSHMVFVGL